MKEKAFAILAVIGKWLVDFCKVMWEDCLKEYLGSQIKSLVSRGINLVRAKRETKEYIEKRDEVVNFVFDKIQLPKILIPFKWLIKKILKDTVTKEVTKALDTIENTINKQV